MRTMKKRIQKITALALALLLAVQGIGGVDFRDVEAAGSEGNTGVSFDNLDAKIVPYGESSFAKPENYSSLSFMVNNVTSIGEIPHPAEVGISSAYVYEPVEDGGLYCNGTKYTDIKLYTLAPSGTDNMQFVVCWQGAEGVDHNNDPRFRIQGTFQYVDTTSQKTYKLNFKRAEFQWKHVYTDWQQLTVYTFDGLKPNVVGACDTSQSQLSSKSVSFTVNKSGIGQIPVQYAQRVKKYDPVQDQQFFYNGQAGANYELYSFAGSGSDSMQFAMTWDKDSQVATGNGMVVGLEGTFEHYTGDSVYVLTFDKTEFVYDNTYLNTSGNTMGWRTVKEETFADLSAIVYRRHMTGSSEAKNGKVSFYTVAEGIGNLSSSTTLSSANLYEPLADGKCTYNGETVDMKLYTFSGSGNKMQYVLNWDTSEISCKNEDLIGIEGRFARVEVKTGVRHILSFNKTQFMWDANLYHLTQDTEGNPTGDWRMYQAYTYSDLRAGVVDSSKTGQSHSTSVSFYVKDTEMNLPFDTANKTICLQPADEESGVYYDQTKDTQLKVASFAAYEDKESGKDNLRQFVVTLQNAAATYDLVTVQGKFIYDAMTVAQTEEATAYKTTYELNFVGDSFEWNGSDWSQVTVSELNLEHASSTSSYIQFKTDADYGKTGWETFTPCGTRGTATSDNKALSFTLQATDQAKLLQLGITGTPENGDSLTLGGWFANGSLRIKIQEVKMTYNENSWGAYTVPTSKVKVTVADINETNTNDKVLYLNLDGNVTDNQYKPVAGTVKLDGKTLRYTLDGWNEIDYTLSSNASAYYLQLTGNGGIDYRFADKSIVTIGGTFQGVNDRAIIELEETHLVCEYVNGAYQWSDVSLLTPGDIDGNGTWDVLDIIRMKRYIQKDIAKAYLTVTDLNGDGVADATDVEFLRKWIVGTTTDNQITGKYLADRTMNIFADGPVEQKAESQLKKYFNAGFTTVLMTEDYLGQDASGQEISFVDGNGSVTKEYADIIRTAMKYGDVMVRNHGNQKDYFTGNTFQQLYDLGVRQFYIWDEPDPSTKDSEALKNVKSLASSFSGLPSDAVFHVNLLPSYGTKTGFLDFSGQNHSNYVNEFTDGIQQKLNGQTQTVSVDNYPFQTTGIRNSYLSDLWNIANKAKNTNGNTIVNFCIQAYKDKDDTKLRVPSTRADISFQTNVGLALGAQSFEYFEYYDYPATVESETYTGILTNGLYDEVKSVNRELLAWDHVFMAFDWQGIKTYSVDKAYTSGITQLEELQKVYVSTYDATVVGEYKYTKGNDTDYGYMITNFTDPSQEKTATVIVELVDSADKVLVYKNGVGTYMKPDGNNKITIKLGAGEGAFVIVD